MRTVLLSTVLVVCALAAAVHAATAQETHFAIEIIGTSRFEDIAAIHDGLRRADGVHHLRVTRSSKGYVKIEGTTSDRSDYLLSDLAGLAQDRFEMKTEKLQDGSLTITLRKLVAPPAP